jgi:hypothetical protein
VFSGRPCALLRTPLDGAAERQCYRAMPGVARVQVIIGEETLATGVEGREDVDRHGAFLESDAMDEIVEANCAAGP